MIDWVRLKAFEREHIERLCRHFFPLGSRIGPEWRIGDVSGKPGLSLGIQLVGDRAGLWHDRATNEKGNFHKLLAANRNCSEEQAIALIEQAFGVSFIPNKHNQNSTMREQPSSREFSWSLLVDTVTDHYLRELGDWRGYSSEFCQWLRDNNLIGRYNGNWAFPVQDLTTGSIIGTHVRNAAGWFFAPKGLSVNPFVVGTLETAAKVLVCESQWDGFAALDKLAGFQTDGVAMLATRGAANARKLAGLPFHKAARIILLPQNDAAGRRWATEAVLALSRPCERLLTPGEHKDLNDWVRAGATMEQLLHAIEPFELTTSTKSEKESKQFLEILSPSQIKNYQPPEGVVLIGDNHITRGSVFVIGGSPGVGKSRATVALAEAGATEFEWFGLKVHSKFKTLIVQNENGPFRLKQEFGELDESVLEEFVRITPPPPYGLCFERLEFRAELAQIIQDFDPDVVIIDPWNAVAKDDRSKGYLETFEAIRSVIPAGDGAPAIGIVAHTRKPQVGERASGRALLNLLAGSYVLGSVPRTVFVLQAASDDVTDNRVVFTCCKNNDGELGDRSVWERSNGLFLVVHSFDWEAFDSPETGKPGIKRADLAAVFEDGNLSLSKGEAVKRLMETTGKGKSVCYDALKIPGRFDDHLVEESGALRWEP